jgi:porphobilinogen synthase
MLAEVRLSVADFISPIFLVEGRGIREEISTMPGVFRYSTDTAMETVSRWRDKGLRAILLFGVPDRKDAVGSSAWDENAAVQRMVREIKVACPELVVLTDVCLCEYTDHGHCGVLKSSGGAMQVDNDTTLELLTKVAVSHARAGADMVAPSAMMDGQVAAIRTALDEGGFTETGILAYSAKFASSLYGPFRDAADCAPKFGDRKSYQMDYRSARQAMAEVSADIREGADIVMVKPAGAYLDIISKISQRFDAPIAAYHVSGEYAMIRFAAQASALDEQAAVTEIMTGLKRAGADLIITYYAEKLADWIDH